MAFISGQGNERLDNDINILPLLLTAALRARVYSACLKSIKFIVNLYSITKKSTHNTLTKLFQKSSRKLPALPGVLGPLGDANFG